MESTSKNSTSIHSGSSLESSCRNPCSSLSQSGKHPLLEKAATDQEIGRGKGRGNHDFIMGLENGYDTLVGDYGVELSGSAKATPEHRAQSAPIPRSSLWTRRPHRWTRFRAGNQRAMGRVLEGRTSFVVAHGSQQSRTPIKSSSSTRESSRARNA